MPYKISVGIGVNTEGCIDVSIGVNISVNQGLSKPYASAHAQAYY